MVRLIGEGGPIYRKGLINFDRRGAAAPPSLILDSLSAERAYSPRLLRTAYGASSPCIQVRRSSDNALANIPFKFYPLRTYKWWLDEEALLLHVGSASGFIRTTYDQSGNGRHITQPTDSLQWRIVNSGVIERMENVPVWVNPQPASLDYVLGSDATPSLYAAGQMTALFVLNQSNTENPRSIFCEARSTVLNPTYVFSNRSGGALDAASFLRNDAGTIAVGNTTALIASAFSTSRSAVAFRDTGSQQTAFANGVAGTPASYTRSGVLTLDRFALGGNDRNGTFSHGWPGRIAEAIFFTSAWSNTDIINFQTEQNATFLTSANP